MYERHTDALVSRPHVRPHVAHRRKGSVAACDIARHTGAFLHRPHVIIYAVYLWTVY